MKPFIEYLKESIDDKKYIFKIKVAGDLPDNCKDVLEASLSKYHVLSFSKGKTSPIQAKLQDFPALENESVTVFDVELQYPVTSTVLTQYLKEQIGLSEDRIKVRSFKEEEAALVGAEEKPEKKKALLLSPDDKENNQALVGDKKVSTFLKDLAKVQKNHQPQQYKGVNDELLARKLPKGD